jgi:hypothetical protein
MDDNKMLIDHMDRFVVENLDILLEDYNNNYSCLRIVKVMDNNIEVEEDDMLDNT